MTNRSGRIWRSILSVDPGTTTGWAWALVQVSGPGSVSGAYGKINQAYDRGHLRKGQLNFSGNEDKIVAKLLSIWEGSLDHCFDLGIRDGSGDSFITSFITEDFIIRMFNSSRSFLSPVRINAKLDWLMSSGSMVPDIHKKYSPSAAKSVVTDERMKVLLSFPSGRPHESDALRHLVLHLIDLKDQ